MEYSTIVKKYINNIRELCTYTVPSSFKGTTMESVGHVFMKLTDNNFEEYSFARNELYSILLDFICDVIKELDKQKKFVVQKFNRGTTHVLWVFNCIDKVLYVIKKFGIPTMETDICKDSFARITNAKKSVYVSLVESAAGSYIINANNDLNELSLKEFIIQFWGEQEYIEFINAEKQIEKYAEINLGYKVIKGLTSTSTDSFYRFLFAYIWGERFRTIIKQYNTRGNIRPEEVKILNRNFYDNEGYKAITGGNHFSESMITAEWLFYSVANATSVDLTFVAMGYFKAFEQVLYDYIIQHRNEDRKIRKVYCKATEKKPDKIFLNETSIKQNWINTMLDSLLTFLEDNTDLFLPEISEETREYIFSVFDSLKHLRNGYFHKDNINDKSVVEQARETTFVALYYFLGAMKFSGEAKKILGIPLEKKDSRTLVYEYLCSHRYKVFYVKRSDGWVVGSFQLDNSSADYLNIKHFMGVNEKECIITKQRIDDSKICGKSMTKDVQINLLDEGISIYEGEMKGVPEGIAFSGIKKAIYEGGIFLVEGFDSKSY